ncbi:MAG: hypothetical protein ACRDF4_06095, partial [Rhabdochlamydiaceae bacterium]
VYAFSAEPSARLAAPQKTTSLTVEQDNRAQILRSYLEQRNSPLADHADTLIKEADANHIDWKMVAAISGVESGFGIAIPAYSYNAWGFGIYGDNVQNFTSWDDGITVVSESLRNDYMNSRGETTIYQIGSSYAASPTWAARVQGNMDDIDQYASRFDKPTLSISL